MRSGELASRAWGIPRSRSSRTHCGRPSVVGFDEFARPGVPSNAVHVKPGIHEHGQFVAPSHCINCDRSASRTSPKPDHLDGYAHGTTGSPLSGSGDQRPRPNSSPAPRRNGAGQRQHRKAVLRPGRRPRARTSPTRWRRGGRRGHAAHCRADPPSADLGPVCERPGPMIVDPRSGGPPCDDGRPDSDPTRKPSAMARSRALAQFALLMRPQRILPSGQQPRPSGPSSGGRRRTDRQNDHRRVIAGHRHRLDKTAHGRRRQSGPR